MDAPKPGDVRYRRDYLPPATPAGVTCLAVAGNWVMARRPGRVPFVLTVRDWFFLLPEPPPPGPPSATQGE